MGDNKSVQRYPRPSLTPLEEAALYKAVLDCGLAQQRIADELGVERNVITNKLLLLTLGREGRFSLTERMISEAAAQLLLRLSIFDEVATVPISEAEGIVNEGWESWADYYAKRVLWSPCNATSFADVEFAVNEMIGVLYQTIDRPIEGLQERIDDIIKRQTAGEQTNKTYDLADIVLFNLKPDFSRLSRSQIVELHKTHNSFFNEYLRRHPDQESDQ